MSAPLAHMIAGSMGFPSKMPGTAYGLPAQECRVGSKLALIMGTTCHDCYALKGNYVYDDVQRAQYIRLAGITHPLWCDAMVYLLLALHQPRGIKKPRGLKRKKVKSIGWHRWHDAGDIQSVAHLGKICEVAKRTPMIRHWLPTREVAILQAYRAGGGEVPANLLIRVSATKVDGAATKQWPRGKRCTAPDT